MARWLVALAVVLVSRPVDAGGFRVEQLTRKVVTSTTVVAPGGEPSLASVSIDAHLIAVERIGALEIVDARTGRTVASTPLSQGGIQAVVHGSAPTGAPKASDVLLVKTRGDLIAIDRATGAIRWVQPASSIGNPAFTRGEIVDTWVDRTSHRYGLVSYDPVDGRRIGKIELGATGGWYDIEHVVLSPDGPDDLLVSAMFGVD